MFTTCKHRRADGHGHTAQTGWRKDVWAMSWSWKTSMLCVYHFYIALIYFCVFLCVPQTNTCQRTPLSAPTLLLQFLFILTCVLPWGLSHVDQRMHRKNRKGKKKLPISVFPTSVECHRQVFFFHITTLKIRKHTRYVAPGCGVCVCQWVFACVYVHGWVWF